MQVDKVKGINSEDKQLLTVCRPANWALSSSQNRRNLGLVLHVTRQRKIC